MKIQDSFGERLKKAFPHLTQAESLKHLMDTYKTYRGISSNFGPGVAICTISRWGRRLNVSPPPPIAHLRVIRSIATVSGGSMRDRVSKLHGEEGTWVRVSVRLGVTVSELKEYRRSLGILPTSPWKRRIERGGYIYGRGSEEDCYRW